MNCRFKSLKKLNVFTKDVCLYMYIEFESLFEVVVHCYIMCIICNLLYVYKLLNCSFIPGSHKVTSIGQICETTQTCKTEPIA